jgi:hypothetical protein
MAAQNAQARSARFVGTFVFSGCTDLQSLLVFHAFRWPYTEFSVIQIKAVQSFIDFRSVYSPPWRLKIQFQFIVFASKALIEFPFLLIPLCLLKVCVVTPAD